MKNIGYKEYRETFAPWWRELMYHNEPSIKKRARNRLIFWGHRYLELGKPEGQDNE